VTRRSPLARVLGLTPVPGPVRALAAVTFVNSIGNGVFATVATIYLVRVVGLSVAQVGVGLALGGCAALLTGVPLGLLADRIGAKPVFVALLLVQGTAVALYSALPWVHFLVVTCLVITAERGTAGVRNAFIAAITVTRERVQTRAYLRTVLNAGSALGAGLGGIGLVIDSRPAFVVLLGLDTATFVVSALGIARIAVPRQPRPPRREPARLVTDWRFLGASAAQAVLSLHAAVLTIALPLWITTRTDVPQAVMAVVLVVSTLGAVLFQVRVGRRTETASGAARGARRAGVYLAVACVAFAPSDAVVPWVAVTLLLAGATFRTAGELFQAASGWSMSYAAAPDGRMGAYQSAYSTMFSLAVMAGPLVSVLVVSAPGSTGWLGLAVVFAAAGFSFRCCASRA
jgi:MFS family permease